MKMFWTLALLVVVVLTCVGAAAPAMVLPKEIGAGYKDRPVSQIDGIVIHHSAGMNGSLKYLRLLHRVVLHRWPDVGYHFIIQRDGTIVPACPITKVSYHAGTGKPYNRNHTKIGVVFIGEDDFTEEQYQAWMRLLERLLLEMDRSTIEIEPHHEKCPGEGFEPETEGKMRLVVCAL